MIAKLNGKIDEIKPTEIILDVNGVGYQLSIPFTTYENIQDLKEVQLYVYTLHKDDQFKLFGFSTGEEKTLFTTLININGIGPVMALSIISGIKTDMLIEAVRNDNPLVLTKIPGIGKNKAEKLIFELKRKMKKLETSFIAFPGKATFRNDAIEALISLGFDESRSAMTVEAILKENPESPIEKIIKDSLKSFSS